MIRNRQGFYPSSKKLSGIITSLFFLLSFSFPSLFPSFSLFLSRKFPAFTCLDKKSGCVLVNFGGPWMSDSSLACGDSWWWVIQSCSSHGPIIIARHIFQFLFSLLKKIYSSIIFVIIKILKKIKLLPV